MGNHILQRAFVLHRRAYSETSFLVELLTEQSGRVCVIAKGARGPKSPFRYLLEPFILLTVSFRGKGELPILQMAESLGKTFYLQDIKLFSGLYVNELLIYLLHRHDANPEIFSHYLKLLERFQSIFSNDQRTIEIALRIFEKSLLHELGYGVQFEKEARSDQFIQPHHYYHFRPGEGFKSSMPGNGFLGEHLLAIARNDYASDAVLKDSKRLMRMMFEFLLGERTIESRKLFSSVASQEKHI
ncbi:MAG: DNA repair protein RecO [Gammaproteobacteria bacterium]|nr:DNA repair protein RecO [Gammaproteobacteria bacterium]